MLERYHKQKRSSKFKNKYKKLNKDLNLNLNVNEDFDLIKLSIYDKALSQKKFFENQFESVRNDCFDMWDYLSFYEKNDLILLDTNKQIHELKSFDYDGVKIYIPFFNKMLNSLYATEIAVLEKPQFFRLYHEFKDSMLDFDKYGLDVYVNEFSYCKVITHTEDQVILFDDMYNIFYKIGQDFKRFPLFVESTPTSIQIKEIAQLIIEEDIDELHKVCVNQDLASKRFIKRYKRMKRKEEKQKERKRK